MNTMETPTDSMLSREMVSLAINRFFRKYFSQSVIPDQRTVGETVRGFGKVEYQYEHAGITFIASVENGRWKDRDISAVSFKKIASVDKVPFAHRKKVLFFSPARSHAKYIRLAG